MSKKRRKPTKPTKKHPNDLVVLDELTPPELYTAMRRWKGGTPVYPDADAEDFVLPAMQELLQKAARKAGLPEAVFGQEGRGGGLAFLGQALLQAPLCVFERPNKAQSAQTELQLQSGERFIQEAYTIRYNARLKQNVQGALTGRQENVLYSLFNDTFLRIGDGPQGQSYITGNIPRLREMVGAARSIKNSELVADIRAVGELRVSLRNVAHRRDPDAIPYRISGAMFTMDVLPDRTAKSAIDRQPDGPLPFLLIVNDDLVLQVLHGLYQKLDLEKFWRIPKPRDRHVYAYLCANKKSVPMRVTAFCQRNGFAYPADRRLQHRARQTVARSLDAVAKHTGDFKRMSSKSWFVDPQRVGWLPASTPTERRTIAFKPMIPADVAKAYRRRAREDGYSTSKTDRILAGKAAEFRRAYKHGGMDEYEAVAKKYRAEVAGWQGGV